MKARFVVFGAISLLSLRPSFLSAQDPVGKCVDLQGCSSPVGPTIPPVHLVTEAEREGKILARKMWVVPETVFGEIYFETKDGERQRAEVGKVMSLEEGGTFITGPYGRAQLKLPDGTIVTIGASTEFVVDEFTYDLSRDSRTVSASIVKGVVRWMKAVNHKLNEKITIRTPGLIMTVRGTDVEAMVEPGGGGYIKLYSGEVALDDYDTGETTVVLRAGEMVSWAEDLKLAPVAKIPPAI